MLAECLALSLVVAVVAIIWSRRWTRYVDGDDIERLNELYKDMLAEAERDETGDALQALIDFVDRLSFEYDLSPDDFGRLLAMHHDARSKRL